MQQNLEQHASFDDGVRALKFYLKSVIVDPTIYEATTITDIIDMFARDLACHFADEVSPVCCSPPYHRPLPTADLAMVLSLCATRFSPQLNTLDPDILRNHFTTRDLSQQGANLQKQIIKDYKRHLYTALPVIIINTPPGQSWPLLSPLVRRVILPLVLGRKFRSSWKCEFALISLPGRGRKMELTKMGYGPGTRWADGKWPEQLNVFSRGGGGVAGVAKEQTIREGTVNFSDDEKKTMKKGDDAGKAKS